ENMLINAVELEGLEAEIIIERGDPYSGSFGHVFIYVDGTVYTYGRYAEVSKAGSSSRLSRNGQGVLIKLEGSEALAFVEKYVNEYHASVYLINDADKEKIKKYFNDKFNASNKVPTKGKYANNPNARVIDEYDLFTNNCTTTSCNALKKGNGFSKDIKIGRYTVQYDKLNTPDEAWAYFEKLSRDGNENVIKTNADFVTSEPADYIKTTNDQDSNNPNKYKSPVIPNKPNKLSNRRKSTPKF